MTERERKKQEMSLNVNCLLWFDGAYHRCGASWCDIKGPSL